MIGPWKVIKIVDYLGDTPLNLPKTDMLQFFTRDDMKVAIRPSGTEPKIKFYFSVKTEVNAPPELPNAITATQNRLAKLQTSFVAFVNDCRQIS
jgi:phosphoglucomutase